MQLSAWKPACRTALLAMLVVVLGQPVHMPFGWTLGSPAFAQDDDGGDDDGGDDDGGDDDGNDDDGNDDDGDDGGDDGGGRAIPGRGDTGRVQVRTPARQPAEQPAPRRARAAQPAPPPPAFARGEIVVTDLSDDDLAGLQAEGFDIIERVDLDEVAVVLHRLRAPQGLTLEQARDRVRSRPTGATGDFNHYYRWEQDSTLTPAGAAMSAPEALTPATEPCAHMNCALLDLIGWPAARDDSASCRVTVSVGVVDTGVNAGHENLAGADLEVLRLIEGDDAAASQAVHGTAVSALLVGKPGTRAPGLVPEAPVLAIDVFGRDGEDERASVASLVKALDLLAVRGVRVINLSLAGPPNAALEETLSRLVNTEGIVVLAAAGNGGPTAEVAYPAGYPTVLAVTAVDQRGQIYRRAQRGAHVDLAAPGVEVWSATSVSGVRPRTGTSFAVPFATAVAAILRSRDPAAKPEVIAARMRALVRDLGAPGPDEVFGAGVLSLDTLCAPDQPMAASVGASAAPAPEAGGVAAP